MAADESTLNSNEGTKTKGIVIFVFIGLFLVAYVIYMFEGFKNNWFPFQSFSFTPDNIPINSVLPLGEVTPAPVVTPELQEIISNILEQNEDWYTNPKSVAIKLPGDQPILGPSDE